MFLEVDNINSQPNNFSRDKRIFTISNHHKYPKQFRTIVFDKLFLFLLLLIA